MSELDACATCNMPIRMCHCGKPPVKLDEQTERDFGLLGVVCDHYPMRLEAIARIRAKLEEALAEPEQGMPNEEELAKTLFGRNAQYVYGIGSSWEQLWEHEPKNSNTRLMWQGLARFVLANFTYRGK